MKKFYCNIQLTKEEFDAVRDAIRCRRETFQKSFGRAGQRLSDDKALLEVLGKMIDEEYEAEKVYDIGATL